MLRSREEIIRKRKELLKSAKAFRKKIRRLQIIMVVMAVPIVIAVVYSFEKWKESDSNAKITGLLTFFIACGLAAIVFGVPNLFLSKWEPKRLIRAIIAKNLREILELLDKPGGENVFYFKLDQMVKAKEKRKSSIPYKLYASISSMDWGSIDIKNVDDAPLHAYVWVASPGGVPGAKEE